MKNNDHILLTFKVFLFGVLTGIYSYFLYKAKAFFPEPLSALEEKMLISYPSFIIFSVIILIVIGLTLFRKEIKALWSTQKESRKKR